MHKNARYNIVQAEGNGNPLCRVIDGQRTDSGHMAPGAQLLSEPLPRAQAIQLADAMQSEADALERESLGRTYAAELRAACLLASPDERRSASNAAHERYEAACRRLAIKLPVANQA